MPSELEEQLGSADFTELQAYYNLAPWGPQRDNLHAAQVAALVYNVNRGKGQPATIDDFMYKAETQKRAEKDKATIAFLRSKQRVKK